MELVKGIPITRYCDEHKLPPRQRLELFIPVCQAVQHAHQKGIIHRDLKPSNVLVAEYDDKPVPKIIDFGVAKATGTKLTEKTMFTNFGQIIGTLEYMSPEQAKLNALDIDTRSDIYALGVLLYELLTGTTPLERKRLSQAALDEMLRMIREEEPPKPSTRLSTTEALPSIAALRGLEPKKLSGIVRGELDWIVMKCLEKDRNRRYETVGALAADLQNHLSGEAVLAHPPSPSYRLRKFVKRHKPQVLAAVLLILVLLAGLAFVLWHNQELAAIAAAEKKARETAEQREAETNAVLDFVDDRIFGAAQPKDEERGLGHDVQLRDAIKAALPFLEKTFADRPLIEARIRRNIGTSLHSLGELKLALEQFETALAICAKHLRPDHHDTLKCMKGLANTYADLARYEEAVKLDEEYLGRARVIFERHHLDILQVLHQESFCYMCLGRYADAIRLGEETLALQKEVLAPDHVDILGSMVDLATCRREAGQRTEALKLCKDALTVLKAKYPEHRFTAACMGELATLYDELGQYAESLKLNEESFERDKSRLGMKHLQTMGSMHRLATSYDNVGRYDDALKMREQTLQLAQANVGSNDPRTLEARENLAISYARVGQMKEAISQTAEVLRVMQSLHQPDEPRVLSNLATFLSLATDSKLRDPARARQLAFRATELEPNSPGRWATLGMAHYRLGEFQQAIKNLEKGISLAPPDDPEYADAGFFLAMAQWKAGNRDKASESFAQAVKCMAKKKEYPALKQLRAEAAELLGVEKK